MPAASTGSAKWKIAPCVAFGLANFCQPSIVRNLNVGPLRQALPGHIICIDGNAWDVDPGLGWLTLTQKSDSIHLVRRLRLGGERRGEEAAGQGAEERAPVHH